MRRTKTLLTETLGQTLGQTLRRQTLRTQTLKKKKTLDKPFFVWSATAAPSAQPDTGGRDAGGEPARGLSSSSLDARNSVFSHDGRLFRPVRRLCHELLAQLPDVGIEIYRTKFEFEAEESGGN